MPKLTEIAETSLQSVLVYGPPKSGKTELCGKLAEEFNIIYVGMENGHATLTKLPREWQERIDVIILPDSRSYPIAAETCLKLVKGGPCIIDNDTGKVVPIGTRKPGGNYSEYEFNKLPKNTIVLWDSLTQLTNSIIAHITKNMPDDYKLQFDDWGHLAKLLDIFLGHIQVAKYNTVCISHETEAELEDGTMKIVPVAGSRNFSRNSAKYFGHVVYCEVKNKKHVFTSSTTGTMKTMTGSRTNVQTEKMDEASLIPIFKSTDPGPQSNGQIAASKLAAQYGKKP